MLVKHSYEQHVMGESSEHRSLPLVFQSWTIQVLCYGNSEGHYIRLFSL